MLSNDQGLIDACLRVQPVLVKIALLIELLINICGFEQIRFSEIFLSWWSKLTADRWNFGWHATAANVK